LAKTVLALAGSRAASRHDSGKALAGQVKQLWRALAEETVTGC
jgi:hypothetical protein